MILALIFNGYQMSGEVFNTAGWTVGRGVWAVAKGENEMTTLDECLQNINRLCQKGKKDLLTPEFMVDSMDFQAR